jgi:hypothetical protein
MSASIATGHTCTAKPTPCAEQAAVIFRKNERIRLLWLTESLATRTVDAQNDVGLAIARSFQGI